MHAADLLTNRARLTPDREAMLFLPAGDRYTYGQLNARANRLAHWMQSLGVKKGDRVSILACNGLEYVDLFYGLAKIGAILAPLNWRLVARELVYIVNDCEPRVLLCGPEFTGLLAEIRPEIQVAHYAGLASTADTEPLRPPLDPDDTYAIAGMMHTLHQPIVSPNVAGLGFTIAAFLMILIGGIGTLSGALVGAAVYRLLEFFLDRWFGKSASFILGVVFVLLVLFVPYGIVGTWRMRRVE
jgi:acyl-CoA synthetase (AMP-forming)/AMP-acid ligase II